MSTTYSINISPTESTSYGHSASDTHYDLILGGFPDNIDHEVSPNSIRNSIISTWDVPSFKETTASSSNISYIGIDTGNPVSRDIKQKIFIGKRSYSGTHSYISADDILIPSLLSSDVDIFLYNTKPDSLSQLKTRVSILAGTNKTLYDSAPYIQSQIVVGTAGQILSLDIVNPSTSGGDISISSVSGVVFINNISYPTISNSGASASSSKVLRNDGLGGVYWDSIVLNLYNSAGATGSTLSIFGSSVLVNGFPLEFTSDKETPISFYGVNSGRTFNNTPISEVLREILYPYLNPIVSLNINKSVAELGTFPSITLNYSVTKRSLNVNSTTLINMIPGSIPPIISNGHLTVVGTSSGVYISNTNTTFQITSSDGTQSVSASQSLNFVYPYFSGTLVSPTINFAGLSTLNKIISTEQNQTVGLTGSGYIYFIYDNSYPVLSHILDQNGLTSSFTYSVVTLTSPSWLWASHQFKVYRSTSLYSFGSPAPNYQFKY